MQATSVSLDPDTGILEIRLNDGTEYQVTNAGHAKAIADKVSPGGMITFTQKAWLEQYRVAKRETSRDRLRARLQDLRREIREI